MLCCVYMRHFDNTSVVQIEGLINVTEILQSVIDVQGSSCPIQLFGRL